MKKTTPHLIDEKVFKALSEIQKNMNGIFLYLKTREARRGAKNRKLNEL